MGSSWSKLSFDKLTELLTLSGSDILSIQKDAISEPVLVFTYKQRSFRCTYTKKGILLYHSKKGISRFKTFPLILAALERVTNGGLVAPPLAHVSDPYTIPANIWNGPSENICELRFGFENVPSELIQTKWKLLETIFLMFNCKLLPITKNSQAIVHVPIENLIPIQLKFNTIASLHIDYWKDYRKPAA